MGKSRRLDPCPCSPFKDISNRNGRSKHITRLDDAVRIFIVWPECDDRTSDPRTQVTKTEVQRSRAGMERRIKGAGGWRLFCPGAKRTPEQSPLCSGVGRHELPASCSQTLEPNFLWCFVVLSGTFRSVLNIF